eukprot:7874541-Heterocapsa_arctica.AAC.1
MEAVKEATKKPVPDKINKNKEMVTCPDCGLSITFHNLKYTHKRYGKALKEQNKQEELVLVLLQFNRHLHQAYSKGQKQLQLMILM